MPRRKFRYRHPFVECDAHPGPQRSYIVCKHVMAGAPIFHLELADDKETGVLACKPCDEAEPEIENFVLVCAQHCAELGWLSQGKVN